jgi:hypothetical protein
MVSTIKGERVSACHSDTFGTIFVQCGTPNNSKSKYQDFTLSLPLCGHVCVTTFGHPKDRTGTSKK